MLRNSAESALGFGVKQHGAERDQRQDRHRQQQNQVAGEVGEFGERDRHSEADVGEGVVDRGQAGEFVRDGDPQPAVAASRPVAAPLMSLTASRRRASGWTNTPVPNVRPARMPANTTS
jgi:hypothetical protein